MKQQVHHAEPMRVGDKLGPHECVVPLEEGLCFRQLIEIVGVILDVAVRRDEEPGWPEDDLTRSAFRRRLRRYAEDQRCDQAYPFFLFRSSDGALLGGLTIANVRRGVAQAGSLGYWIGAPFARQGYMSRAVRAVIPFSFDALRLHRLEAVCLPHNEPSKAVLAKVGFHEEGLARQYLRINGQWADHLLFALLRADYDALLRAAR